MAARGGTADRRRLVREFAIAFVCYAALTLLLFRDLFGRFSTAVPHDLLDPPLSVWILWWNAHHLPFVGSWWDGLSFFPGHGSLAFSDHRVGLGLIATPIQWLGGTPIFAYNAVLLSSFALSALGAHILTWHLTRSHAAGAVSGLIFGFNPFRIAHLGHLELLAVWWLPLALTALHLYVRRFELRWLAWFAVFWWLQGLSSGYYLMYSAPLVGLWAIWFARDRGWRGIVAIAAACAVVLLALLPALLGFRSIQDQLHLHRDFEIDFYGADVTGLLSAAPLMTLWRLPSLARNPETEIYLGIFASLLAMAGTFRRRSPPAPLGRRWHMVRLGAAVLCTIFSAIAVGSLFGTWGVGIGPIVVSVSKTVKPLSLAILCLIIVGLVSPTFLDTCRRRSVFGFYASAALLTWGFALGPGPKLFGSLLLYRGPYALLMLLPGFDERLRAPARFAMMTALVLAVAAGLALVRVLAPAPRRVRAGITAFILAAIVADSWFVCPIAGMPPLAALPDSIPANAAVMTLPLGNAVADILAVYQSIAHGHHVVNGYSGYVSPHYPSVRAGLADQNDALLTALTTFAPICVVIARADDPTGAWAAYVERHAGSLPLERTANRTVYLLPALLGERATPLPDQHLDGTATSSLRVRAVTSNVRGLGRFDVRAVIDGDIGTAWYAPELQNGYDEIVLELDDVRTVSGMSIATGPDWDWFPRRLIVTTSIDGTTWDDAWDAPLYRLVFEATLRDPASADADLSFSPRRTRFVRLRQLRPHPDWGWAIAELHVHGY